jgi:uncharacterized membrane protein YidH (DUF202 family)
MSTRTVHASGWKRSDDAASNADRLPTTQSLQVYYLSSFVIVIVGAFVTVLGLFSQTSTYPTEEAQLAFIATDALTLFIGLPILLISMWLTNRVNLIGLLCWPGALFYFTYTYIPYLLDAPFSAFFLAYLLLIVLSGYSFIGLLASIHNAAVKNRLHERVPARLSAGVLILLGAFFLLNLIVNAINALNDPALLEPSLWIADAVMAPALVLGGVLLWRRTALGYTLGGGLLLLTTVLALGVIPVVIHQDYVQGNPFDTGSFIVLLAMGLLCLIPFGLFVRGANRA